MKHDAICQSIHSLYPDAEISVEGSDCNLEITVVSDAFDGMSLLKRQRSLMKLFADELASGRMHALSIKAKSISEQAN